MDIRKFFNISSTSSKRKDSKAKNVPEKRGKIHKKDTKKRTVISDSESDSEDPLPKKNRNKLIIDDDFDDEEIFQKKPVKKLTVLTKQKKSPEKVRQTTSADDFFGNEPIKRQEKAIKKTAASSESVLQKCSKTNDSPNLKEKCASEEVTNKQKKETVERHSSKYFEIDDSESNDINQNTDIEGPVVSSHSEKTKIIGKSPQKNKSGKSKEKSNSSEKHFEESSQHKDNSEKKRAQSMQYRHYLQRQGPQMLGSKEIPEGKSNCLAGLTFVLTGVLESFEKEEIKEAIEKYKGKVTTSVSKNTSYLVSGRDPGTAKIQKAQKLGTKIIDEDELLNLISTIGKDHPLDQKNILQQNEVNKQSPKNATTKTQKQNRSLGKTEEMYTEKEVTKKVKKKLDNDFQSSLEGTDNGIAISAVNKMSENFEMWVDKYKPTATKQIIGQQGDRSNMRKLHHWLLQWSKTGKNGQKPVSSKWRTKDDGSSYKAALLSGPPGIGKTTTAQLVCKECGFDYIELNASDTRSKRTLKEEVLEILRNQSLVNYANSIVQDSVSCRHAIIMDEVDGMAGNEDRGGVQELIALIKSTKIPIICICNDRSSPKIRSLANYCYDLRFTRPRVEQIKAVMMSIAFKENIQIPPDVLNDTIIASNQDIRQVLHTLSLWSAKGNTSEHTKNVMIKNIKHVKLGPFDVLRKIFSHSERKNMSLYEKSDLFFNDYSLIPLFVQENYISVQPSEAKGNIIKHLQLLSSTADSICDGDLVEKQIRTFNNWSLLPVEAIYSSVIPGELMDGYLTEMINFPSWLGKNSSQNHIKRLLQELHSHMHLRVSGNPTELNLDQQLVMLKNAIVKPLINKELDGIVESISVLENYCLLRQDLDSIVEVTQWSEGENMMSSIDTKVKSAFTRAYNKEGIKNPYSVGTFKKSRKRELESDLLDENVISEESDKDDDLSADAMVKVKKPSKRKDAPVTKKRKKNNV